MNPILLKAKQALIKQAKGTTVSVERGGFVVTVTSEDVAYYRKEDGARYLYLDSATDKFIELLINEWTYIYTEVGIEARRKLREEELRQSDRRRLLEALDRVMEDSYD